MFEFNFKLDEDLALTLIRGKENSVLPTKIDIWYLNDTKLQSKKTTCCRHWPSHWATKNYYEHKEEINHVLISFPLIYRVESIKDKPYFILCPSFSLFLKNSQEVVAKFGKGAFSNFTKTRNLAKFLTSSNLNIRTLAASAISNPPIFSREFSTNYFQTSHEFKEYMKENYGFKTKILSSKFTKFYNDAYSIILDSRLTTRTKNEIISEVEYLKEYMKTDIKFTKDLRVILQGGYRRNNNFTIPSFGVTSINNENKKFKQAIKIKFSNYYYKQPPEKVHNRTIEFIKYYETIYNKIIRLAGALYYDNVELSIHFIDGKEGKQNLAVDTIWVRSPHTKKYRAHWKKDWNIKQADPIRSINTLDQLEDFLDQALDLYKNNSTKIDFHQLIPKISIKSFFKKLFKKLNLG